MQSANSMTLLPSQASLASPRKKSCFMRLEQLIKETPFGQSVSSIRPVEGTKTLQQQLILVGTIKSTAENWHGKYTTASTASTSSTAASLNKSGINASESEEKAKEKTVFIPAGSLYFDDGSYAIRCHALQMPDGWLNTKSKVLLKHWRYVAPPVQFAASDGPLEASSTCWAYLEVLGPPEDVTVLSGSATMATSQETLASFVCEPKNWIDAPALYSPGDDNRLQPGSTFSFLARIQAVSSMFWNATGMPFFVTTVRVLSRAAISSGDDNGSVGKLYIESGDEVPSQRVLLMVRGQTSIERHALLIVGGCYLFRDILLSAVYDDDIRLICDDKMLMNTVEPSNDTIAAETVPDADPVMAQQLQQSIVKVGLPRGKCRLKVNKDPFSYCGTITSVLDRSLGIFVLDGAHILTLVHASPSSLGYTPFSAFHCGTVVRLDNAHAIVLTGSSGRSRYSDRREAYLALTGWHFPLFALPHLQGSLGGNQDDVEAAIPRNLVVLAACLTTSLRVVKFAPRGQRQLLSDYSMFPHANPVPHSVRTSIDGGIQTIFFAEIRARLAFALPKVFGTHPTIDLADSTAQAALTIMQKAAHPFAHAFAAEVPTADPTTSASSTPSTGAVVPKPLSDCSEVFDILSSHPKKCFAIPSSHAVLPRIISAKELTSALREHVAAPTRSSDHSVSSITYGSASLSTTIIQPSELDIKGEVFLIGVLRGSRNGVGYALWDGDSCSIPIVIEPSAGDNSKSHPESESIQLEQLGHVWAITNFVIVIENVDRSALSSHNNQSAEATPEHATPLHKMYIYAQFADCILLAQLSIDRSGTALTQAAMKSHLDQNNSSALLLLHVTNVASPRLQRAPGNQQSRLACSISGLSFIINQGKHVGSSNLNWSLSSPLNTSVLVVGDALRTVPACRLGELYVLRVVKTADAQLPSDSSIMTEMKSPGTSAGYRTLAITRESDITRVTASSTLFPTTILSSSASNVSTARLPLQLTIDDDSHFLLTECCRKSPASSKAVSPSEAACLPVNSVGSSGRAGRLVDVCGVIIHKDIFTKRREWINQADFPPSWHMDHLTRAGSDQKPKDSAASAAAIRFSSHGVGLGVPAAALVVKLCDASDCVDGDDGSGEAVQIVNLDADTHVFQPGLLRGTRVLFRNLEFRGIRDNGQLSLGFNILSSVHIQPALPASEPTTTSATTKTTAKTTTTANDNAANLLTSRSLNSMYPRPMYLSELLRIAPSDSSAKQPVKLLLKNVTITRIEQLILTLRCSFCGGNPDNSGDINGGKFYMFTHPKLPLCKCVSKSNSSLDADTQQLSSTLSSPMTSFKCAAKFDISDGTATARLSINVFEHLRTLLDIDSGNNSGLDLDWLLMAAQKCGGTFVYNDSLSHIGGSGSGGGGGGGSAATAAGMIRAPSDLVSSPSHSHTSHVASPALLPSVSPTTSIDQNSSGRGDGVDFNFSRFCRERILCRSNSRSGSGSSSGSSGSGSSHHFNVVAIQVSGPGSTSMALGDGKEFLRPIAVHPSTESGNNANDGEMTRRGGGNAGGEIRTWLRQRIVLSCLSLENA